LGVCHEMYHPRNLLKVLPGHVALSEYMDIVRGLPDTRYSTIHP
jgi:hypothetical protein